jgi:hypothetical protein
VRGKRSRHGDYTRWFREMIKDESLAKDAAEREQNEAASPSESRGKIKEAIETRYRAVA